MPRRAFAPAASFRAARRLGGGTQLESTHNGRNVTDTLPGLELLPAVTEPVWGIDPSSKRIGLGVLVRGAGESTLLTWDILALPLPSARTQKFADGYREQV